MTRTEVLPVEVQLVPVEVPEKCPECAISPIFHALSSMDHSYPYCTHQDHSNSPWNLFSIQFIFHFLSSFKTFHEFLPKIIPIWVLIHTQAKPKDLLGFTLNPNSIACHLTMNPTSKRGFPTFLVDLEYLPTLPSIIP